MSDAEHEHPHEHPHPPVTPLDGDGATGLSRRDVLAGAASGLILAATPGSTAAAATRTVTGKTGATRVSRILPGRTLVHADLHNHTLLSDGAGDPALAYESMRSAGLDVAALTDHATLSDGVLSILDPLLPDGVNQITGLSRRGWRQTRELADAANEPGVFTAIRGFEWTNPLLGHVNVWFTDAYTDVLDATLMGGFYRWLTREDGLFGLGDGGADGLAGFNHPGRERGRFNDFKYEPKAHAQLVSLEMFNRFDDYLFEGWADGVSSPLVTCLNAGWRPGLSGVTDEHGTDWGYPEGKGRTGMWVTANTRDAVRQAMIERRFFATRVSGLRLDATADGAPMGGSIRRSSGDIRFTVDLDRGAEWDGKRLDLQVLRPGDGAPVVADVVEAAAGRVTRFTVPLSSDDGGWVVLRVSDPTQPNGTPGPDGHPCNDFGIAYTSPWWFDPA